MEPTAPTDPVAEPKSHGEKFNVVYDKLIISVGCYSQTFGTPGVKENAFFLKDIGDARRIHKRILDCFEIAALPTTSETHRIQLLHFAVIGGGPTGMEFAAELRDLVREDLSKLYPDLAPKVKIEVLDVAPKVLSMFDDKLGKYAMETFKKEGVLVKTSHHVEELRAGLPEMGGEDGKGNKEGETGRLDGYTLRTREDGEFGIGMCVWSTGNMMNPFVRKMTAKKFQLPESATFPAGGVAERSGSSGRPWMIEKDAKTGAIVVNDRLQVQLVPEPSEKSSASEHKEGKEKEMTDISTLPDVFALGDNASVRGAVLPATAQTASQEALWLAKRLNKKDIDTQRFTFR